MTSAYRYIAGVYIPEPGDRCVIRVPEHLPPLRCRFCGWDAAAFARSCNGLVFQVMRRSSDSVRYRTCGNDNAFSGEGSYVIRIVDEFEGGDISMSWLQPVEDDDA